MVKFRVRLLPGAQLLFLAPARKVLLLELKEHLQAFLHAYLLLGLLFQLGEKVLKSFKLQILRRQLM